MILSTRVQKVSSSKNVVPTAIYTGASRAKTRLRDFNKPPLKTFAAIQIYRRHSREYNVHIQRAMKKGKKKKKQQRQIEKSQERYIYPAASAARALGISLFDCWLQRERILLLVRARALCAATKL